MNRDHACRDLKMDESDRKMFTQQIEGLKSVDVDLKVLLQTTYWSCASLLELSSFYVFSMLYLAG